MKNPNEIRFTAKRVDSDQLVSGYFFKTPLTSENFEADHFGNAISRNCISDEHGVVYEIDITTISVKL